VRRCKPPQESPARHVARASVPLRGSTRSRVYIEIRWYVAGRGDTGRRSAPGELLALCVILRRFGGQIRFACQPSDLKFCSVCRTRICKKRGRLSPTIAPVITLEINRKSVSHLRRRSPLTEEVLGLGYLCIPYFELLRGQEFFDFFPSGSAILGDVLSDVFP